MIDRGLRVAMGWVGTLLAVMPAFGCGSGDEGSQPANRYEPVRCEVVAQAVRRTWVGNALGPLSTEQDEASCRIHTCCEPSGSPPVQGPPGSEPNGLFVIIVTVSDDPDEAERIFDLPPGDPFGFGGRSLPAELADRWEAGSRWRTDHQNAAGVALKMLDSNLVLYMQFGIGDPTADGDRQQEVLVELADEVQAMAGR